MRFVWRMLTGRCTCCGKKLNGHRDCNEEIIEINSRFDRLAVELGRYPQAQNCHKCNHLVFEGEPGFIQRYLLVDVV